MTIMAKADGKTTSGPSHEKADVVLGEDWETNEGLRPELAGPKEDRGFWSFRKSPLTRKIVIFNLFALSLLIAGILLLDPTRHSLLLERSKSMTIQARNLAKIISLEIDKEQNQNEALQGYFQVLENLRIPSGSHVLIVSETADVLAETKGKTTVYSTATDDFSALPTPIVDGLLALKNGFTQFFLGSEPIVTQSNTMRENLQALIKPSFQGRADFATIEIETGLQELAATAPITSGNDIVAALVLIGPSGELDNLSKATSERFLQFFALGIIVSIALSVILASTISNPLNDLATAAELGREKNRKNLSPHRVRIPDLTARPDEIGRLSAALRGMVSALYERIDANEQFAADVAHEIKNPLASLRSAVGSLRMTKRDDHREQLLSVIEHDVRRLDRLVSDISNASRLDSELVKEQQEEFDLLSLVRNLTRYLSEDAEAKGIDFISDLPEQAILIRGLEARLAQVLVNLITNAISFCVDGDAIRVWVRMRENRVLLVVEDTGPGIPEEALSKVFERFYSERPADDFGNNSGLGLAISKQIVEAHDGVIWAENIRPTLADPASEPLGARFVVGLPV